MTTIQYFFIILVALIVYRTIAKWRAGDLRFREFLFWTLLWVAIAIVVVYPKTASLAAIYLGVGRGADLLIYSSLLLVFYLLFRIFMALEKLEKNITKVVTKVALNEDDDIV